MTQPSHRDGPGEASRDQDESAFTPILRNLWATDPAILAVCFVDREGECIDYCASLDPFDTKVLGAHVMIIISDLVRHFLELGFGEPHHLHVNADQREILARRVNDDYALVVSTRAGGMHRAVFRAIERATEDLRREGAIPVPAWEPYEKPLDVEVRPSVGSGYAPVGFHRGEERTAVSDVLGWWLDEDEGWTCFRVRVAGGRELTLAHDPESDRWFELTDSG